MKSVKLNSLLVVFSALVFMISCSKDEPIPATSKPFEVYNLTESYDSTSYSPLTAEVKLELNQPVKIIITVKGKNNSDTDISQVFPPSDSSVCLPIVGLYASYENEVKIEFISDTGSLLESRSLSIETSEPSPSLPEIKIDQAYRGLDISPLTLVNSFSHAGNKLPQMPFIFDIEGEVRWYLDFTTHPELVNLLFEVGLVRLANGNFAFGDSNTNAIYETSLRGEILNEWPIIGYKFHHTVIELPNGNFIATVSDPNKETVEDVIIQMDRATGNIITIWDLNETLQRDRKALEGENIVLDADWFHANGLFYDADSDALIISGRHQGVVKLSLEDEVVWVLSPHKGWNESGLGNDMNQYLLTPVDVDGEVISDPEILEGNKRHVDFDWCWYQHSPRLMDNGNLIVYDNGINRHYGAADLYSRAAVYEIDEQNMTVKQVLEYGQERTDTYSSIVSSVRSNPRGNSLLFSPGACGPLSAPYGKIIDIDLSTEQILFEATIIPNQSWYGVTFHSAERIEF